jgi:hypothetical protein
MTWQPKLKCLTKVQLHDVADEGNELSKGIFTAADEAVLRVIVNQFKLNVMKRYKRTLYKTPLIFQCWLQSYWSNKTSFTAFGWQGNKATLDKYANL